MSARSMSRRIIYRSLWKPQSSVCSVCARVQGTTMRMREQLSEEFLKKKVARKILKAHSTLERNYARLIDTNVIAIGHLN